MYRCAECDFSHDLDDFPRAGPGITAGVAEVAEILRRPGELRTRPKPETWSPLEYACHVRDVLLVQRERVLTARRADRPFCEPMGRDERVEHDGYAEQDPRDVARQLTDAALLFTNVLNRLPDSDWDRPVIYTYPEESERSLRWVAVHTWHDVHHHLFDIRRQLP